MSIGYSWEGIRQVRVTLLGRAIYLNAFEVAMSTWGAISSARPFTFFTHVCWCVYRPVGSVADNVVICAVR